MMCVKRDQIDMFADAIVTRRKNKVTKYVAGMKYNRMTLLRLDAESASTGFWICRCDCGVEKSVKVYDVCRGKVQSCGCRLKENGNTSKTHGDSGTPLHHRFEMLKNHRSTGMVCAAWADYLAFKADMGGSHFEGATLDRHDRTQPFSKENCLWVTRAQKLERFKVVKELPIIECAHCGLSFASNGRETCSKGCLSALKSGEQNAKRVLTPEQVRIIRAAAVSGKRGYQSRLAREFGVNQVVISRVARGESYVHIR